MKEILAEKLKMTTLYADDGTAIPVTVVKAGPVFVIEKRGENRYLIGFKEAKKQKKPILGILKKAKIEKPLKFLAEIETEEELKPGEKITVDKVLSEKDTVSVTGLSKGKGFAGTIKRWGFSRGPETHGSEHQRRPGSIGSMWPQRVIPGKKMAGRMGGQKRTIKNLKVVKIEPENNLVFIKGAVPGGKHSLLRIKKVEEK